MKTADTKESGGNTVNVFFERKIRLPYDVKDCVEDLLDAEGKKGCSLNLVFTGDSEVRKLNAEFRGKNKATDVLTFEEDGKGGEVYISVDTAEKNADGYGASLADEIARLVVHGTLHSLGYDHMEKEEEKIMKTRTALYMKLFESNRKGARVARGRKWNP